MFATRFDPNAGKHREEKKRKISDEERSVKKQKKEKKEIKTKSKAKKSKKESKKESKKDSKKESKKDSEKESKKGSKKESKHETEKEQKEVKTDSKKDIPIPDNEDQIDAASEDVHIDEDSSKAHQAVFKRFKRAIEVQKAIPESEKVDIHTEKVESTPGKSVAPIPQPKLPRDKNLISAESKNKSLRWLSDAEYHQTEQTQSFDTLKPALDSKVIRNLDKEFGIKSAFSVQVNVIENVMKAVERNKVNPQPFGDYLVNAATGSGKTLAYLIPVVEALKDRVVPRLRCIILTPTRPLASQVYSNMLHLTKGFDLRVTMLKNDISLNAEHEKMIRNQPDIIISAPGRLVDHITKYNMDLSQLRFLVVDEADRLLNQSYQNWCDVLVSKIDKDQHIYGDDGSNFYNTFRLRCVKIILSATLTTNSEKLSHLKLFKPSLLVIKDSNTNEKELYQLPVGLDEFYIRVPEALSFYKPLIFLHFLLSRPELQTHGLIFVKSNENAIRLSRLLQIMNRDLTIYCVNSTMGKQDRHKTFNSFDKKGGILIATDFVSRGLDFDSVTFVVNYDLPLSTKEYIHRIGRTARANKQGQAFTFCFGRGDYSWYKKLAFSGGVINRHGKEVNEVRFIREEEKTGEGLELVVDLTDEEKANYETNLKELEKEIFRK